MSEATESLQPRSPRLNSDLERNERLQPQPDTTEGPDSLGSVSPRKRSPRSVPLGTNGTNGTTLADILNDESTTPRRRRSVSSTRRPSSPTRDTFPLVPNGTPLSESSAGSDNISSSNATSPQSPKISPRTDANGRVSLAKKLEAHGYRDPAFIFVTDESVSNGTVLTLVKCNLMGNTVYIDVDTVVDKVPQDKNDLSLRRVLSRGSSATPITETVLASKCTNLDLCSMAYDCKDGICILKRDSKSLDIDATEFVLTTKPGTTKLSETDPAIAYPVVKLSDILANNILVTRMIMRATARHHVEAVHEFWKRRMLLNEATSKLQHAVSVVAGRTSEGIDKGAFGMAHHSVEKVLTHLSDERSKLHYPPGDNERAIYDRNSGNTQAYQQKFEDLIRRSHHLLNLTEQINLVTKDLSEMLDDIKTEYSVVEQMAGKL